MTKTNANPASSPMDEGDVRVTRKRPLACATTYFKMISYDYMCPANRQFNDAPGKGPLDTPDYSRTPKCVP